MYAVETVLHEHYISVQTSHDLVRITQQNKCKILQTNLYAPLTLPRATLFEHAVFLESTPWKRFKKSNYYETMFFSK